MVVFLHHPRDPWPERGVPLAASVLCGPRGRGCGDSLQQGQCSWCRLSGHRPLPEATSPNLM